MLKIIIGLGNPGREYAASRHNAGFWLLDAVAGRRRLSFAPKSKFSADTAADDGVYLFKPQTFMNLSGETAAAALNFYRVAVDAVLVAHDEVDFSPGTIRLKQGGGDAGHRGLADISRRIGNGYWRLRIGVGKPAVGGVHEKVLQAPPPDEQRQIDAAIAAALDEWDKLLAGDYDQVMQCLHTPVKTA